MSLKKGKTRLINHTITKVYYTLKEIEQFTNLSRHSITKIIISKEVPFHQKCKGGNIRIHINNLNTYFNIFNTNL